MRKTEFSVSDRISIITLILNSVITISLFLWNINISQRLATVEADNLAPKLEVFWSIKSELGDTAYIHYSIHNTGKISVEELQIMIMQYKEYPIDNCVLEPPFDNIIPRVTEDISEQYTIMVVPELTPDNYSIVECKIKGFPSTFKKLFNKQLEGIPEINCLKGGENDPNYNYSRFLPGAFITAKNLEQKNVKLTCF